MHFSASEQLHSRRKFLASAAACLAGACGVSAARAEGYRYPSVAMMQAHYQIEDFPLMRQPDMISCGPTCCAMLIKHFGGSVSIETLKKDAGTRLLKFGDDEIGFTWPSRVKKAMERYRLNTKIVKKATLEDLPPLIHANRPPILLVRSSPKTWHYVIVIGHRGNRHFLVADPLGFKYWRTAQTLDKAWSFAGDIRGNDEMGGKCKVCGGKGKFGIAPCLICGGDGVLFDMRRQIVQGNLIEPISGHTMIVPQ